MLSRTLVARMDSLGDVLLTGPAVRACAAAGPVTFLCSPTGAPAAGLLPGVEDVVVARAPWIEAAPGPVTRAETEALVAAVAAAGVDRAVVCTSFHQSPLPLAMLLRLAGVKRIGAISVDYPGSLLDVRHHVDDDIHEVERALSLAEAMGFLLPAGDDGRLRVDLPGRPGLPPAGGECHPPSGGYVVVHPGASVPARAWHAAGHRQLVAALVAAGHRVVVTGGAGEAALTRSVAAGHALDLGGRLDLPALALVLAGARVVVVANTGPAHLAAAVGTPVVSLFAPTVPASRWHPWGVPHLLLGDQDIACAGCRARLCPVGGHPCIDEVPVADVLGAVDALAGDRPAVAAGRPS